MNSRYLPVHHVCHRERLVAACETIDANRRFVHGGYEIAYRGRPGRGRPGPRPPAGVRVGAAGTGEGRLLGLLRRGREGRQAGGAQVHVAAGPGRRGRHLQLHRLRAADQRDAVRLGQRIPRGTRRRRHGGLVLGSRPGAVPGWSPDRLDPHRRHALRHGPGRRHPGARLGLGRQLGRPALPRHLAPLPHAGRASVFGRDRRGRCGPACGLRRQRHPLLVRQRPLR
jgi:hypothetical protein